MNKRFLKVALFVLVISVSFGSFLAFAQPAEPVQKTAVSEGSGVVTQPADRAEKDNGILYIAAALAVGFSSFAAGWAVSTVGSAALGAISEKPELAGRALIFVGLAEGIAIYGLIVAIMLIGKAG